jgi:ABC-2 type transport system permease protein
MSLAGTDFDTFSEFQKQTEKYRFEKTKSINEIHLTQIKFKDDNKQRVSTKNWQEQPEFSFKPVSIQDNISNGILSIAALIIWALAVF